MNNSTVIIKLTHDSLCFMSLVGMLITSTSSLHHYIINLPILICFLFSLSIWDKTQLQYHKIIFTYNSNKIVKIWLCSHEAVTTHNFPGCFVIFISNRIVVLD